MHRIPSFKYFLSIFILIPVAVLAQTQAPSDTAAPRASGVDTLVVYSASDSIVYSLSTKIMKLYGKGEIKYRTVNLKAERIDMDWNTSTLTAYGVPDPADTAKKRMKGTPILVDAGEEYRGLTMLYNFKTQKGKITVGETEIEKGYYRGEDIKKVEPDVLFVEDGRYTTCEVSDPHYYFSSPKMKVILGDKVIAAPVYLYIGGVPVFMLPFGVFPNHGGRRSGIVAPAYGDDFRRGRYLTHLGYYWAMSDYTDLKNTFDFYTKGGWVAHSIFRYSLRYEFTGSVSANFTDTHFGEKLDPDRTEQREYNLNIRHNQQIDPTTRADVDFTFTSGSYYQNTSTYLGDLLRQNVISNATLYKTWGSGTSLTLNAYRDQNLQTGEVSMRLPSLSISKSQMYPFRRVRRGGTLSAGSDGLRWYELIGLSYSGQALNRITKQRVTSADSLPTTTLRRDERVGASHSLTFNASPRISEFNVTPFFNYSERWYTKSIRKQNFVTSAGKDSVVTSELEGFKAVRFFNTGISASTKFYGIFPLNAFGIGSFRHTVTPSISYSFQPDFSKPSYGYWGTYRSRTGQEVPYSFYEREIFGGAPRGEVQSIGLNVGHLFEMKTAVQDTSDKEKKYQLLNLGTSVSYNFAADSLRLSELSVSYRTNIGDVLGISGASSFNFYKFDYEAHRRVNKFLLHEGEGLAQLTSFSLNLSTSLRGERSAAAKDTASRMQETPFPTEGSEYLGLGTEGRPDFSIPWNLSLAFDYSLNKSDPSRTFRSSNLRGNLSFDLTSKWKISASASYDIINKQVAAPVINIYRDLHCWEMNFDWTPKGIYRGFKLELRVKAPQLQDLKLTKQESVRSVY